MEGNRIPSLVSFGASTLLGCGLGAGAIGGMAYGTGGIVPAVIGGAVGGLVGAAYGAVSAPRCDSRQAAIQRVITPTTPTLPMTISNPIHAQPTGIPLTRVESWDRRYRRV